MAAQRGTRGVGFGAKPSNEPHAPIGLVLGAGLKLLEELTTIFQKFSQQAPLRFGLSGIETVLPIRSLRSC